MHTLVCPVLKGFDERLVGEHEDKLHLNVSNLYYLPDEGRRSSTYEVVTRIPGRISDPSSAYTA